MTPAPDPDSRAFRRSLGSFATGVCVVAARSAEGRMLGVTVNAFSSVSLDPPLILVCLARSMHSHDALVGCGGFAVSILGQDQTALSRRFATHGLDKWQGVPHRQGLAGGLILEPSLASFDCETHARLDGGDHTILLGRVRAFAAEDGAPLLYFRGAYDAVASLSG